ncbi:caspase family protein [Streptomyces sp. ActVer]|uniref:caspase family protein n=1 Tax=Streptomyces sp. ActVer TaxID=3014558 RepID=UPI0022B4826E|nr:caspase family protein [Streptomyces sp. ActVer]MCZ4510124.1 caspase family protein [Streptomyces sp. ActVer]
MTGPEPPVRRHDPARVHALIVGIEKYDAGDAWDLPGPARDALAFRRLLSDAGVPEAQLHLHLAPLPPFAPDTPYRPADHATVRRALVRELPAAQGDVLWVWWGGHGVLDRAEHLRLLCSDATVGDKVALDLDSALARYAGDAVPGLREQLWLVDACETFEEALAFRVPLPADALPVGQRNLAHRQSTLRAAGRGRAAANDPVRATGLFSEVLLDLLAARGSVLPGLPDPEELFSAVRVRMEALREAGRTLQHPEIRLQSPQRTETLPPAEGRMLSALGRAVEALMAYPWTADPVERQAVVTALDPRVHGTIPRHPKARTDVTSILTALGRRRPEDLWELFDAVVSLDDDPERRAELADALREFGAFLTHRRRLG